MDPINLLVLIMMMAGFAIIMSRLWELETRQTRDAVYYEWWLRSMEERKEDKRYIKRVDEALLDEDD